MGLRRSPLKSRNGIIGGAMGRCTRENCKYLHPPAHLKTQLEINGRNNLIQQKTAAAMLAQQMQFMIPGTTMQPMFSCPQPTFPVTQGLGTNHGISYAPYLSPMTHGMGLVPTEMLPSSQVIMPGSPPVTVQGSSSTQKLLRTDKLEVCRGVQRGNCARGETDCRFAHPSDSPMIDTSDNTVHRVHGLHQEPLLQGEVQVLPPSCTPTGQNQSRTAPGQSDGRCCTGGRRRPW
ncbi:hypothetical protein SKAU_G00375050 [Synaphobranchus kaupii]|uniref:C3H1-type domain-containing protein n=1 Tax=Synaphobranchus kaupii TaxID=118154 RepID=A0A9Q1EGT5_SYNKA|nr:hypothetical protein SKAU_G00375050 [Synaphobranchus kaupii]